MNFELLRYTIKSLVTRRMRSFLTIVSIMIGIMAIFALISFGMGLSNYVEVTSKEMGADKIIIQPKTGSIGGFSQIPETGLTERELEFISHINGIEAATGLMIKNVQVKPDDNIKPVYVYLMGVSTDTEKKEIFEELMMVDMLRGRDLRDGDKLKATLGYRYTQPDDVFEEPIQVGQKIIINNKKVEVVGFYESIGNPEDDRNIYLTQEGVKELLNVEDQYEWVMARVSPSEDVNAMAEKVEREFRDFRDEEEGKETFFVQTFNDLLKSFSSILDILNAVLVMIALISVVIAGINIMNTMYTSVIERTKQIGIMKAIGARNSNILNMFVAEAGFLGLTGGLLGILLGYGIASLGGKIAEQAGYAVLQPIFPASLIIGCLLFATVVGAVSGLAPAVQASKQNPVDSLHYE